MNTQQLDILNDAFRGLAQGQAMLNRYLDDVYSTGSPQTLRSDIAATAEILKSLGSVADRIAKLMANDHTYMSEFEAIDWWKRMADAVVAAIEDGLASAGLDEDTRMKIRDDIVDELDPRARRVAEEHAQWRAGRRRLGFKSTQLLTHEDNNE